jgi:glycosyltransferase involved in cell wall biosynthesis
MLRLMRNRKTIIATDFGSIRGYVADGETGFLVKDMERDLPAIVARIDDDPQAASALGEAAYARYCRHFSPQAGEAALGRILEPLIAG